jgi:hypothetical protein
LYALATREKDLGIDEWFQNLEHAAQEGIADAQAELGATYLYDKTLPQDDEKTFQYLKNAADQGVGIAYKDLGVFYATQEIYDQALLAYAKAKEFGHDDTDSLMFVTSIRQYLNEANLFRYISYVNGYNTEMTSQAQRILAQRLNEDYNELRADCLFGASEADFVGNINAVFLTAEGIYTCAKGGEACSFLPWREFVGLTLYKESYSALSFKDTVIFNRNGLKQILIPYVSNAAFLLPELKKLQNRFAALFAKYRHLFD